VIFELIVFNYKPEQNKMKKRQADHPTFEFVDKRTEFIDK